MLHQAWASMSATSQPVLAGSAFTTEYQVMALIGAGTALPLLALAAIGAVARQDPAGLLRTALLRLPMALLLTGVVVELVSLGLSFTDQASVAVLSTGADAAARAFGNIEAALGPAAPGTYGFGELILVVVVAMVGFILWIELVVRSAAVAVAALFLPLALVGLVWPATSHFARRLGETLAGLVLMKLVMAAVLSLAGGALAAGAGGVASIVEGVALLGLTTFAPFSLFRLIPMIESGAVAHLEGVRPAQTVKDRAWSVAASSVHSARAAVTGSTSDSGSGSGQMQIASLPARPPGGGGAGGPAGSGPGGPTGSGPRSGGGPGPRGGGSPAAGTGEAPVPPSGSAGARGEAGWVRLILQRSERGSRGTD